MILKRTRWYLHNLDDARRTYGTNDKAPVPEPDVDKANLIGSLLTNGLHGPCIDFDFPCRLIPSRTPGHFHLYLEQEVEWEEYKQVLKALYEARLVEYGFYQSACRREQTFLRPPPDRFAATCTTVAAAPEDVLDLVDVVRAIVGTGPPRDELDKKISGMEERVYSIMAAKIDEIVARRVQRGIAAVVSGQNLPEGSDASADAAWSDTLSRVPTPFRRHRK